MGDAEASRRIELVRGSLTAERVAELVGFWSAIGVLDEAEARRRAPDVVCAARDEAGRIVGVNSVFDAAIPLVGGRRFWVYRSLLPDTAGDELRHEMLKTAFRALDDAFDPDGDGPIGLCLLVDDPAERRRRPQAIWDDPRLVYAGYLADGRQARIAYFEGARIDA